MQHLLLLQNCVIIHIYKDNKLWSAGGSKELKGELVGVSAVIERDMDCTPLGLPLYVSQEMKNK